MRFFLRKSLLFLLIALLAVQASGWLLAKMAFESDQMKPFWMLSKKDQNYDFAFIGSSRVFYTVDILEAEKEFGGRGINLAFGGASFLDNYLTLQIFLKDNRNKIKTLFLQVDEISLNPEKRFSRPFSEYIFYDFLRDPVVSRSFREKCGLVKYYLYKYFPPFMYIEFNHPYKIAALGSLRKKHDYESLGGSEFKDGAMADPAEALAEIQNNRALVSPEGQKDLQAIINLAEENNIDLILYSSPHYAPNEEESSYFQPISEYVTAKAEAEAVPYLNFNFSPEVSPRAELFYKGGHLNRSGVAEFMKIFLPAAKKKIK